MRVVVLYIYTSCFNFFSTQNHNESSTHAHQQPPSYQSAKQSNSKHINTSDTVEYTVLSKATAIEIGESSCVNNYYRINCNKNNSVNTIFEKSADSDVGNMSTENNCRDRLGLWGNDSEVSSAISGLHRLRFSRYNKVSKSLQLSHF